MTLEQVTEQRLFEYTQTRHFVGNLNIKEDDSIYKLSTPDAVIDVLKTINLHHEMQENLVSIMLDTKNNVIGFYRVSVGLIDRTHVHSREVFRQAIANSASKIVLAHNHPSGDPTPSKSDISATHDIIKAGNIIGIQVMDHIIVAEREEFKSYSMREYNII